MGNVRIRLQEISKSYYSETAVTQALRKISLTFSEGEFVAITGESGSGKSTLLNIIGGMDTFDDGEMFVDGEPTFPYDDTDWEDYRRNKIGYVFQDYSLVGHYTALDNVMSALLIMDREFEEAKQTALSYLAQVGLAGFETHRASELSSGQKQRLSIARALAKNTGIIVADEPTGNLDSETGNQIIQLLKELSKDRLVIMVTHNYDQVELYATRKIRLHEGEIISDVSGDGSQGEASEAGTPQSESDPVAAKKKSAGDTSRQQKKASRARINRIASYFAKKNRRTQPGRAALFTTFLCIISTVSFLFIGELYQYAEDVHTRVYEQNAFYRKDDTRLVVKRADGGEITAGDVATAKAVTDVVCVDSCDYANDINYYIKEDEDYEYLYSINRNWWGTTQNVEVSFLDESHFVNSTDAIDESDLAAGVMPESRNEIVLYSNDESVLGTTKDCYFTAHNIWSTSAYYKAELTVVGLLAEPTDQVYFSVELAQMLSMKVDGGFFRLYYNWDTKKRDYMSKEEYVPVIADDLAGNEVRMSEHLDEGIPVGEVLLHYAKADEDGRETTDVTLQNVMVQQTTHEHSYYFIEVSREFFDTYYQPSVKQMSVYIASYARTDEVIRRLRALGYEAISTYRVSATTYDYSLASSRLVIIAICAAGLIALVLAELLILRSLMKIRIKDYFVMKFIGMRMQVIRRISFFEIGAYAVIAMAITVVLMGILRLMHLPVLDTMLWYIRPDTYLVFVLYNLLAAFLTVLSFNHLLKGRLQA